MIAGILKATSKFRAEKYICGRPGNLLEWALVWPLSADFKRRGTAADGLPFPSRSWLGWAGPVQMHTTKADGLMVGVFHATTQQRRF